MTVTHRKNRKPRKPRVRARRKLHKPRHYHEESGKAEDWIRARIKDKSLRAYNLTDAERPDWWIDEDDWKAFLDARSNVQTEPVVDRNPPRVRQYV